MLDFFFFFWVVLSELCVYVLDDGGFRYHFLPP